MTDPNDLQRDDDLEAFLDGLMSDAQQAAFAESLRNDPERRRQAELQERIDGALAQLFHVAAPTREQISSALTGAVIRPKAAEPVPSTEPASTVRQTAPYIERRPLVGSARTYWGAIGLAAAAAIACIVAALLWHRPEGNAPYFAARPVAEIYRAAVASGFEPTYDCREPERFAATFRQRQGQPLQLLAMNGEMQMMGLAYVGGLSRQTTAVLCRVEGAPVMVFVDRASADSPHAADIGGSDLHVFRQQRDGLVFYEVTPLDKPRVTPLLAPLGASTGPSSPGA